MTVRLLCVECGAPYEATRAVLHAKRYLPLCPLCRRRHVNAEARSRYQRGSEARAERTRAIAAQEDDRERSA